MNNILKDTMLALYSDDEQIYEALQLVDWTEIDCKFRREIFSRIDEQSFHIMDSILHSDEYLAYKFALDSAAQACTIDLAQLIMLAVTNEGGNVH